MPRFAWYAAALCRKLFLPMKKFVRSNPFPVWQTGSYTYDEAQAHSAEVDDWLGLQIAKVEAALCETGCRRRAPDAQAERQQLWIGLAAKSLLTPYVEIRKLLENLRLREGSVVVDLGAAYGRMGFVIGKAYPALRFIGYEYVGERVAEATRCLQKHRIKNAKVEHADLTSASFRLPVADVYFIYDYGTEKAIEKTLYDLKRISKTHPITIVARGKACHDAIKTRHNWLKLVSTPEPAAKSSIFISETCAQEFASLDSSADL